MTLVRPALDPSTLPARTTSGYPEPYRARVLPRDRRALNERGAWVFTRRDGSGFAP
jgi:hypothetical protein